MMRSRLAVSAIFMSTLACAHLEYSSTFGQAPFGFSRAQAATATGEPPPVHDNVVAIPALDMGMAIARKKAHETLPRLFELIDSDLEGWTSIKFPLAQNGLTEHIWLDMTEHRDGMFIGILANEPVNGDLYQIGDEMEIDETTITDWMFSTGDEIYGGYTVRATLGDMPKALADEYRARFRD